jgi:hypothetical protein
MPFYGKGNPKGIDIVIQKIQVKVYDYLVDTWDIDDPNYISYGRVYRNQDKDGKYIPEAYVSDNEYVDPLYNDKEMCLCTSFFGVGSDQQSLGGGLFTAKCHIIFSLNIAQLKPGIIHRADEEVHIDCLDALRKALPFDTITNLITWNDNVFREYNGYKAQNGIIFTDMHPKHNFRINFDLTFINNDC